jgi:hypothetical protein
MKLSKYIKNIRKDLRQTIRLNRYPNNGSKK